MIKTFDNYITQINHVNMISDTNLRLVTFVIKYGN